MNGNEGAWDTRTDRELIRAYTQTGSEDAFATLARRYARLIYATCLRELGERTLAEDAAQNVLLLLSQKARSLSHRDSLAGWLYSASCYLSQNLRRQERRRRMAETSAALFPSTASTTETILWEEIEPHFHEALNRLRPDEREAVLLRFLQEQKLREIGACLGISENTARMRVSRALEKIRRHLDQAGLALGVGALALLLEERAATALPEGVRERLTGLAPRTAALGGAAGIARRRPVLGLVLPPPVLTLSIAVTLLSVLSGLTYFGMNQTKQREAGEQRRFFMSLADKWEGTLEFVDDRSGQRFRYPTTVVFEVHPLTQRPRESLVFTAYFTGSDRVDETTLIQESDGQISVQNGGANRSHDLTSRGAMRRGSSPGAFVFEGDSPDQRRQTRLQFFLADRQLILQEDTRNTPSETYRLRNRFTLQRHDPR